MKQITVVFVLPELLAKDFTTMLKYDENNLKNGDKIILETILVDTDEKSNLLADCIMAAVEQKDENRKHFLKTKY